MRCPPSSSGWTIFYNWLIVLPAEISAATILVGYWDQTTNPAVYITAGILIITIINLMGAKSFGETEFWLTSLKILCIVSLLILSVLLMAGVGDQGVIGFRYWKAPWTLFNQYPLDGRKNTFVPGVLGRFLGFWSVLLRASFSFQGSEIIGLIAGETKDPRKILPMCIRSIWIRVFIFYVMGTMAISVVCPSNDVNLSHDENTAVRSPFVIAIHHAGIRGLASLIVSGECRHEERGVDYGPVPLNERHRHPFS
jgi:amino acid transporter